MTFRLTPEQYSRITLLALIALVMIVLTGAAVRITGSGLGCPDWPNCNSRHFVQATSYHQAIEQGNRMFTGLVALGVILAVLGSLLRVPRRRDLTWLSLALVAGVIVQAVLGGLAVIYELRPEWVMAHFVTSMLIIWAALVLHNRSREPEGRAQLIAHRDYLLLGRSIAVLTGVVIFVGTMVTGSGPHGGNEHVKRLGFQPHDITKVHGTLVWILVALVVLTLWRLNSANVSTTLIKRGELVVVALLTQAGIGYFQYATGLPAALVLLHVAGAVAVWLSVIWFNLGFYERYGDVGLAVYDGPVSSEGLEAVPSM